jgi:hypothetical protein
MIITVEGLADELRRLKSGEGVRAARLLEKTGPILYRLSGFDGVGGAEVLRSRLSSLIQRHADRLPLQQRTAALAALGLHPDADQRFLNERLQWLLPHIDRYSERTADRMADRAILRIAQSIVAEQLARKSHPRIPTEWYTGRLDVTVRLDLAQPEFRERRTIVARENGVSEIPVSSTVPKLRDPDRASVAVEVVSGGTLLDWSRTAPTIYVGRLALPRPLSAGERHEYELIYRPSPPDLVQPMYLLSPIIQCDHLTVRARFGPALPATVWRLDGVYRGTADDPMGEDVPTLEVAGDRWVETSFDDLAIGLTYGIRWAYAGGSTGRPADSTA